MSGLEDVERFLGEMVAQSKTMLEELLDFNQMTRILKDVKSRQIMGELALEATRFASEVAFLAEVEAQWRNHWNLSDRQARVQLVRTYLENMRKSNERISQALEKARRAIGELG